MTTALRRRNRVALAGFLVIAGFFLVTEHRAHLLGWWPFLLLAACPFLHVFGHGGHGGHGASDESAGAAADADAHAGHGGGSRSIP